MFIIFKREENYLAVTLPPPHTLPSNPNVNLAVLKKKIMDALLAGFLCRSKTPCIFSIQHSINA